MLVDDNLAEQLILIGGSLLRQVERVMEGNIDYKGLLQDYESFEERLMLLSAAFKVDGR